ncbi:outer membrane beta-barrel protein [Neolewinella lacunae]|uniref:PorT family protein n=1 Tax=Neolewinella lacunae TaxID=1517758 RepID=A0A923PGL8_9BACT|nr:outer membrane beta-barrel protein [Neolewinella lacunae]MBC6992909.1 PorT family protein [Neolewinella lacunae]MDN3633727.1 outer membrane beta-barrel protein [Neolewinella lacunae]
MRPTFLLCLVFLLTSAGVRAQEFSGGFRAGLNFNSFDGPAEQSADGTVSYESFQRTTGFHVGATFALAFTDLFGFKADLLYSQKGGQIDYEGPSYFYLYSNPDDLQGDIIFGQRTSEHDIINSYIDVPVTAYFKLGKLELEGGVSAGFLVASRVSGADTYQTNTFGLENDIIFSVEGNYFRDLAGGGGVISRSTTPLPRTDVLPPDVISAFYNSDRDEPRYRRYDFGLIAGASYFLNSGLYFGVRYQHGLTDLSRDENDLRLTNEDRVGGRAFNAGDEDFSRSIQASVGFRF